MQKTTIVMAMALMVTAISFSYASAEIQVIIPPGASIKTNPFSLSPAVVNVKVNDTVTWINQDSALHSVTTGTTQYGYDGRFDSGPIQPGQTFSYKFEKAGTYPYFCLFHPWMTGVVNVSDGSSVYPAIGITFSTDKSSYQSGENILVSGQVSQFIPNEIITIWVEDSQGKTIATNHIETEDGIKFETSIPTNNKLWVPGDSYTIFGQYGYRSGVAESKITIKQDSQMQANPDNAAQSKADGVKPAATSYPGSYSLVKTDQDNYVSVQTGKHIYFPGDDVEIFGSIWSGMFQQVGGAAYLVTAPLAQQGSTSVSEVIGVKVRDAGGNLVLNQPAVIDNDGYYHVSFKIPENTAPGQYAIDSTIETKAGLINTLDASVSSKLGSSGSFVVSNPSQFAVKTGSGDFAVKIGSNSTIDNFKFNPLQKSISFTAQGPTGTKGITLVTIPKMLLGGQLQVYIDGILQPYGSENILETHATDSTTLEINYHHSTHTIQIVGTQAAAYSETAVPEFSSIAPSILAISAILIVVISVKNRKIFGVS